MTEEHARPACPSFREALSFARDAAKGIEPVDGLPFSAERFIAASVLNQLFGHDVSDIIVHGDGDLLVERLGVLEPGDGIFSGREDARVFAELIAAALGCTLSEVSPAARGDLGDGSQVMVVSPPLSDGFESTVRRFRRRCLSLGDLVQLNSIDRESADFLRNASLAGANILVAGTTGSGKTALLSALTAERRGSIVTVEERREIYVPDVRGGFRDLRHLYADGPSGWSTSRLAKETLRMRPDDLVVGETRGQVAYDILVAMNAGHGGLTSVLAASAQAALRHFVTFAGQSPDETSAEALRDSTADCFDLVVTVQRMADGSRKVTSVDEVVAWDAGKRQFSLSNVSRYRRSEPSPGEPYVGTFLRNPGYHTGKGLKTKLQARGLPFTE